MTDPLVAALEIDVLPRLRADRIRRESLEYRQSLELYRAVVCAPNLATCETILRRPESVPRSRLDSEWARAYGL
jgi:hypothetical protein